MRLSASTVHGLSEYFFLNADQAASSLRAS